MKSVPNGTPFIINCSWFDFNQLAAETASLRSGKAAQWGGLAKKIFCSDLEFFFKTFPWMRGVGMPNIFEICLVVFEFTGDKQTHRQTSTFII